MVLPIPPTLPPISTEQSPSTQDGQQQSSQITDTSTSDITPTTTDPAPSTATATAVDRPRARLGPTEIVEVGASDSEDDEGETLVDGGEAVSEDFLKDWPDDSDDLQLQHLRLKNASIPHLRLPRFGTNLRRLCLRQNELSSPLPSECFEGLSQLEELDLYDNRLGPRVEDAEIAPLVGLTSLDLSFNNIRHIPNLPSLKKLIVLYLVQNKITRVEEGCLDWCADTITSLELGGNRIRVIENLEKLVHLTELWLGKNKIRALQGLSTFSNLKILSIQSNRITKIENLEGLVNLEELYLSHNGIKKIEGLEKNTKLRTLDVGNNEIEEIENISHLTELEEFWASNNKISSLKALDSQLRILPNLATVYLEGNPCQTEDRADYRRKIILALPQVKQIDAT